MSDSHPQIGPQNLGFVEELYASFLQDPDQVSPEWRDFFRQSMPEGIAQLGPQFSPPTLFGAGGTSDGKQALATSDDLALQDKVARLLRSYRVRGHLIAKLDPLELPRPYQPELDPAFYAIAEADRATLFESRAIHTDRPIAIGELIDSLQNTYCSYVGLQYMHIDDIAMKNWLEQKMELDANQTHLSRDEQLNILRKLADAVNLEEFIQKKYQGAKSFSLEGAEGLIPLLSMAIEQSGDAGVGEVVIGMAHRGRLNVLANIMGKSPGRIFHEFDDARPEALIGRGDVKYHLGHSSDWQTEAGNSVHLTLCFNPSHLEFVNTVAQGRCRAKQDRAGDKTRQRKMTVLIHGDAAFAGEGIVQETLNLSELEGYRTGGTLHVILNNQIGFTTSSHQSRSCTYATDVAKMLQIPIFHVNGENPDAVAHVVKVAGEFRRKFSKDVVIDMYGYRRWGHNEGDEPAFTQPLLYEAIRKRKSVHEGYLDHVLALGQVTRAEADRISEDSQAFLEEELRRVRDPNYEPPVESTLQGVWQGYAAGPVSNAPKVKTGITRSQAQSLLKSLCDVPDDFTPHSKIKRLLKQRREMAEGKRPLDWGAAELLALASLATEGARIRMSGQDSERGTFSHRHAVLHDQKSDRLFQSLSHLSPNQASVEIVNSPLSEAGVLGFEYGYSLDAPDALVVWEAQFGDFVNAGQVIIDQFISSGEDKWERQSGLVMLLPHGFEGMGPEHSSARIERFLDLCAEDNFQVIQPSTPAQFFHALRRQVVCKWRKPLIVFSPKSLLRLREATNELDEFVDGQFNKVLADETKVKRPERILMCSGKLYYELLEERARRKRDDVAIIRLEQYYPFPDDALAEVVNEYPANTPVLWVQDEPENMGVWRFLRYRLMSKVAGTHPFFGVTRPESASPATGSKASHKMEQQWLLGKAFEMQLTDAAINHPSSEKEIFAQQKASA